MQTPCLSLSGWLKNFDDAKEKQRVYEIGNLTGLKEEEGRYFDVNFERALLLRHIVRTLRPQRILELGTGRGMSALAIADVCEGENLDAHITSVDIIPPDMPQYWPICLNGKFSTSDLALNKVWDEHFPSLRKYITLKTGKTTEILPQLAKEESGYDFIYIDAGHDVYSVFHDFIYSTKILDPKSCMLMDDFTPLENYGLGTCIVASHAPRYYESVEILETEGMVFEPLSKDMTRGMVFLNRKKAAAYQVRPLLLQIIRIFGGILDLVFRPNLFPLKKVD